MILKRSWTVPAATAFLNSLVFVMYPIDTMVLVRVVPILAPITMGIALERLMVPDATAATAKVVVVLLLCKSAVASKPMNKPMYGLEVAEMV